MIVPTSPLNIEGPFGRFADRLLALELPDLPQVYHDDTVAFICLRVAELPSPLKIGTSVLTYGVGLAQRVAGLDRTTEFLRSTHLPLVAELARMVRSLGFAFVWESWPQTLPSGLQGATAS